MMECRESREKNQKNPRGNNHVAAEHKIKRFKTSSPQPGGLVERGAFVGFAAFGGKEKTKETKEKCVTARFYSHQ